MLGGVPVSALRKVTEVLEASEIVKVAGEKALVPSVEALAWMDTSNGLFTAGPFELEQAATARAATSGNIRWYRDIVGQLRVRPAVGCIRRPAAGRLGVVLAGLPPSDVAPELLPFELDCLRPGAAPGLCLGERRC